MIQTYHLLDGGQITASSPEEFVRLLREGSRFDYDCTDQEYMENFARRYGKKNLLLTFFGVFLGALIVVVGYSLGRAYIYSTPEYSLIKLPFEILQAGIGAILGAFIWKNRNMGDIIRKIISK